MWQISFGDCVYRLDDLTLAQLDSLERRLGYSIDRFVPWNSAQDTLAVATAITGAAADEVGALRIRDWQPAEDDLPDMFHDGVPHDAQRSLDVFVCQLCPPFTPRQIREDFTLRDIRLMIAANPRSKHGWS